jgi:GNAT superfamily N-acetyltransferase
MGDGFVLMRLDSLDSLPDVPSLDTVTPVTSVSAGESTSRPHIVLGWSRSIERSRADFVRLHREVGDEMGQDPEVFDSTFGCDIERLAKRMAFLYATAGDQATSQVEPEPELLAVGTCTAWEVGGTGWIHSLVVGADHQGRGLSQVLLGAALHRLRDVRLL